MATFHPVRDSDSAIKIIAIGVSTGGPSSMQLILSRLPRNFPVPILCTQHISPGFLSHHIDWLNTHCKLKVSIARDGEIPQPGRVYYAPEGFHLGLSPRGRIWYNPAPPLNYHCPSVTYMFEAIAQVYGSKSLGLLLTGMGRDGAAGLLSIHQVGGITAAQDEASSVIFGMPKEAIAQGAVQHILSLESIPAFLIDAVK